MLLKIYVSVALTGEGKRLYIKGGAGKKHTLFSQAYKLLYSCKLNIFPTHKTYVHTIFTKHIVNYVYNSKNIINT